MNVEAEAETEVHERKQYLPNLFTMRRMWRSNFKVEGLPYMNVWLRAVLKFAWHYNHHLWCLKEVHQAMKLILAFLEEKTGAACWDSSLKPNSSIYGRIGTKEHSIYITLLQMGRMWQMLISSQRAVLKIV